MNRIIEWSNWTNANGSKSKSNYSWFCYFVFFTVLFNCFLCWILAGPIARVCWTARLGTVEKSWAPNGTSLATKFKVRDSSLPLVTLDRWATRTHQDLLGASNVQEETTRHTMQTAKLRASIGQICRSVSIRIIRIIWIPNCNYSKSTDFEKTHGFWVIHSLMRWSMLVPRLCQTQSRSYTVFCKKPAHDKLLMA